MLRNRKLLILVFLLAVLAAAGALTYRYLEQPPQAARLLPEGNLIVYANLIPLHYVDLGQIPGQSDQEYQDFVRHTGIHAEHDLDRFAAALGDPSDQNAISAVFTGSFDEAKLSAYLQTLSPKAETYAGKTIFVISNDGYAPRNPAYTIRICILDSKTVVVANSESTQPMHHMIDASRASSQPSSLLDRYYHYVPFGSSAWLIYSANSEARGGSNPTIFPILQNRTSVVSLRYAGSLRVQARVISASEAEAAEFAKAIREFIPVGVAYVQRGQADEDMQSILKTLEVQQHGNETVMNLVIPQKVIEKMASTNASR